MSNDTPQFVKQRLTSGKVRILNAINTVGLYSFEITTAAEVEKTRLQWGLNSIPSNLDNFFTWEKFIEAYEVAIGEPVDTILQQWGTIEPVMWPETVVNNSALLVARHTGVNVVIEKVQAIDSVLGPIEYIVISSPP